jgi:hypothetical protein
LAGIDTRTTDKATAIASTLGAENVTMIAIGPVTATEITTEIDAELGATATMMTLSIASA